MTSENFQLNTAAVDGRTIFGREAALRALPRWSRRLSVATAIRVVPAIAVLAIVLLWAILPSLFTAVDPNLAVPAQKLEAPSAAHLFGTDYLGRDLLSRVIHGTRESLTGAVIAVAVGLVLGSFIGLVAGSARGITDSLLMRLVDVLLSIPAFLLAVTVVVVLGFSTTNAAIAVGLSSVATFARLIRSEVLRVSASQYVEAAVSGGVGYWSILGRHILPNSLNSALALVALQLGMAILWIASLSFLGFGAQPPNPEWGLLVSEGRDFLGSGFWMTLFPGLAIVLVVISFNTIGHVIREKSAQ
ncbi:ABC transporter permease [Arthrobacter sp. H-02-3]|uniref:ABC transporter permease n=1 Tax=Arthrobacter sp. H-02-3 TaxID=2703675 RepID=UPI000DD25896|nr:ABC transporter permease [Arthrobacter sp. H-02-3]PVZ53841.1 peptide ABC transporter permease [Arthrobacter sp. H-02-3]